MKSLPIIECTSRNGLVNYRAFCGREARQTKLRKPLTLALYGRNETRVHLSCASAKVVHFGHMGLIRLRSVRQ
jgi:hypothetical protein